MNRILRSPVVDAAEANDITTEASYAEPIETGDALKAAGEQAHTFVKRHKKIVDAIKKIYPFMAYGGPDSFPTDDDLDALFAECKRGLGVLRDIKASPSANFRMPDGRSINGTRLFGSTMSEDKQIQTYCLSK